MKQKNYKIDNSIDRLLKGKNTLFLDDKELKLITSKLKKGDYNIFYPYKTAEKVILFRQELPKISLFKIECYQKLKHNEIMGSILEFISPSYLGDIIIDENNYYFYVFSELKDFIKNNLNMVGRNKVNIKEIELKKLENYERKYEEFELVVSSLRIDHIISRIIKINREKINEKIKNKEIFLNNDVLNKNTYLLRENDIFSIRRYGKYRFIGKIGTTKKNNIIIKYLKYI